MNLDSRNPGEVPKIASHNLQAVKDGRRSDLQIRIGQSSSPDGKPCLNLAEDSRCRDIVRKNGQGGQDELFDVLQMPFAVRGPEGSLVKLADNHGACELLRARHL